MNEDKAAKEAILKACKLSLEYLEANKDDCGIQSRIIACKLAIIKAEKAWNK